MNSLDAQKFDQFVQNHPLGSIHQLSRWGQFQSKTHGRERFFMLTTTHDEHGKISASALVIRQSLPFKKCWLYCPRGPLADYENPQNLQQLFQKIAALARQENAVFLRFDPPLPPSTPLQKNLAALLHARPAHAEYQPAHTLMLDLTLSPAELLAGMKPKGRYNIRVAQKHGLKIRVSTAENFKKDLKIFYDLLRQTTSRDQFSSHPLSFYENMLNDLGPEKAKLYLATPATASSATPAFSAATNPAETTAIAARTTATLAPIAAIIVTHFKDTATYYFGASANESRQLMAPYLLQWQAILDAKVRGLKHYDFLGISPQNEPHHPWAGVSDFKLKFGGKRVEYLPAREIVYQPFWYALTKIAKFLRR